MREFIVRFVIGITALIVGWALGTWMTCGNNCAFDVSLFEAIGAWVSGLGVSVVAALYALHLRNFNLNREQYEAHRVAYLCSLRFEPRARGVWTHVHAEFNNNLNEPVFDLSSHIIEGSTIRRDNVTMPGRTWGWSLELSQFGITPQNDETVVRQAINANVKPKVAFMFTIRGYRFVRVSDKVYLHTKTPRRYLPATLDE